MERAKKTIFCIPTVKLLGSHPLGVHASVQPTHYLTITLLDFVTFDPVVKGVTHWAIKLAGVC